MEKVKGKRHIREDVLPSLDEALWHKLTVVWQKAEEGILEAQRSSLGHQQGSSHVKAVERNLSALIPDDWKGMKLSALDLFLLSAAACLHDAGKAGDIPGDHGHVSMLEICNRAQDFGLDFGEGQAIGWLVCAHNDKRLEALPVGPFAVRGDRETDLRPLAALLCLADALHCDASRVSPQVTKILGARVENHPVTLFRQLVRGWVFDEEGRIAIQGTARQLSDVDTFCSGFEGLRREVEPITATLADNGYPCELVPELDESSLKYRAQRVVSKQCSPPGMDFYHEEDAAIFKGRDSEIEQLYLTVLSCPVSLLVADSGMGKSSLVCAGLFPYVDRLGTWQHVCCRPYDDPTRFVVSDIHTNLLKRPKPTGETIVSYFEHLSHRFPHHRVLVVLDQFEDIADVPKPDRLDDLRQSLTAVLAHRFDNLHVLLVYRADAQSTLGPWLQQVSSSSRSLPATYLPPLDDDGALQALKTLFSAMQIGYEPVGLMSRIIADIKAQGRGLYPPFIQMVAEVLIQAARQSQSVISADSYSALGGVSSIIATYLMHRLEEFGSQRSSAELVLKATVSSSGKKSEKSTQELQRDTQLDEAVWKSVVTNLVNKRMLRPLGADRYEVIHDYFAQLVDEELVSVEARRIKRLQELLSLKAAIYPDTRTPLSNTEMAQLYLVRERLLPSTSEKVLLLQSCVGGLGPAWHWFRSADEEEYLPILHQALSSPHPAIRANSLNLLVALLGRDAVPLARAMLDDNSDSVLLVASDIIRQLASREDLPYLIDMLDHRHPYIRARSADAIGRISSAEDLPMLLEMLKRLEWGVPSIAAEAIARVASLDDLPSLRAMLNHQDWVVRSGIAKAYSRLTSREDLGMLHEALIDLPILQEMLTDVHQGVREAAADAIGQLASRQDLPILRAMLEDEDSSVRSAAAQAIGRLGSRHDLPRLWKILADFEYCESHWAAANAVVQLVSREDLPTLREMLNHGDSSVRSAATIAVGRLSSREELATLWRMLNDTDHGVRWDAANAIVQLVNREDLPTLREMLNHRDSTVRSAATKAVGRLSSQEDLATLWRMLKDVDEGVRRAAADAVGHCGTEADLSPLAEMVVSSPFSGYEEAATRALILLDHRLYCPFALAKLPIKLGFFF